MEEPASEKASIKNRSQVWRSILSIVLVIVLLAGLPIAVWFDLRTLSENNLLQQAEDLNSMITKIRAYYSPYAPTFARH